MVRNKDMSEARKRNRAMISHDLRTALTGITGGLAQIDVTGLDEDLGALIGQVRTSARHLVKLLETAFGESLLEGVETPLDPEPVGFAALADDIRDLWQRRASEKGLSFEVSIDPDCPKTLLIDRSAFHRLVGNLLGNAIKFTEHGGIRILARRGTGGDLVLIVQDTGPGFSEAAMNRIFQMYGRPASSNVPGSGIGLHIVRTLAEKMGGRVSASNRVGGGAEVTVEIPVPENLRPIDGVAPDRGKTGQGLPDLSRLRILLAEDNSTNQLVVTQMLRAMQADPVLASDGVEALARFEEQDFDIALLDIEMPRVSGLDVIRRIRNRLDYKSGVRIIALTAYAMKEHRDRIFDAGADGLIPKPLTSIEDLGNQILAYAGRPALREDAEKEGEAEASGTAGDGRDLINREIYDALSDAIGPESMDELKHKVAEDMEKVRHGVERGLQDQDVEKIRFHTHILISVAGVIGATRLQSVAERLNSLAQRPGHPDLPAMCEQCVRGITGVLEILRTEQGTAGR